MTDSLSWPMILALMAKQFWPVWVALVATFVLSIRFKRFQEIAHRRIVSLIPD